MSRENKINSFQWAQAICVIVLLAIVVNTCSGPRGGEEYAIQVEAMEAIYQRPVKRLSRKVFGGAQVGEMTSEMQMAVRMAEDFVARRLNYPKSMERESSYNALVVEFKDGTFLVRSIVQAKNAFGMASEVPYEAMLKNDRGWSLVDIEVGSGADLSPTQYPPPSSSNGNGG